MTEENPQQIMLTPNERKTRNLQLLDQLAKTLEDDGEEVARLRRKLSVTYWLVIILSCSMFALGVVLISVPAFAAFRGQISELQSLISAGFGITDLTALFLLQPLERIHDIMGDMSQITLAISSFHEQVSLRLLEMDSNIPSTIGKTAEDVGKTAKDSIVLIQDYFKAKSQPEKPKVQEKISALDEGTTTSRRVTKR